MVMNLLISNVLDLIHQYVPINTDWVLYGSFKLQTVLFQVDPVVLFDIRRTVKINPKPAVLVPIL